MVESLETGVWRAGLGERRRAGVGERWRGSSGDGRSWPGTKSPILHRSCGLRFLVDTGAEVSVLPTSHTERKCSHAMAPQSRLTVPPNTASYKTRKPK